MTDKKDNLTYLKDYKQPDYWIKHADLTFDLQDGKTFVTAKLKVKKNGQHNRPLVLDGKELELQSVKIDNQDLAEGKSLSEGYVVDDKSLTLQPADDEFILETKVRIEPEKVTDNKGLYQSSGNWSTQCEAQGFRHITYFLDRPDNMATFTTTVIGDKEKAPVLLSNGNKIDEGETQDGRHYTVWDDPWPKPSYLFALVGGDLDHIEDKFTTMSGREVTLRIYAESKDLDKLDHAMESLKKAMKWDEEKYGREYDLDLFNIVAVDDFNMGAMENKSLNIFNTSAVLANPETSTDTDFKWVEGVVGHEYFHNWTGNRITCRDWFQLCLKEGLTVYRDEEFSADMNSRSVKRINDVRGLRMVQFAEDSGPTAHPPRPDKFQTINNFYTNTVYRKGAEINRMMASLLGEETFHKGAELYFDRFDGQAVTVEDWVQCMADASGRNMDQFMRWYTQAGTPTVKVDWEYNKTSGTFTLTLEQDVPSIPGKSDGLPREMPVRFGLVGPDGKDVVSEVLELNQQKQTYTFQNIPEGCVPSLFRNFSAPIKLEADYSDEELLHLMANDGDGFNQWNAGNMLMMKNIIEQVDNYENGQKVEVSSDVIDAFRKILARTDMDDDLKSLALTLPSYNDIALSRKVVDPQAITSVLKTFKQEIASALDKEFVDCYAETGKISDEYDLKDAGRRSLHNTALSYIKESSTFTAAVFAKFQYDEATNMTERYAAFSTLVSMEETPAREACIQDFYQKFKDEALVINKWVSAQAASAKSAADIEALAQHESFKKPTANRMRALYRSFAASNPETFHAEDGSGYKVLADFIIKLDAANPEIAAGLVGAFAQFRNYKPELQNKMEKELERITSTPEKLSTDISEKLESYLGKAKFDSLRNKGPSNDDKGPKASFG